MDKLIERFIEYVKINTQSDENSDRMPSNPNELTLGKIIVSECEKIGIHAEIGINGYVYFHIEGNVPSAPPIGFIAHLDTAPDASGENVNPRIIKNYDGENIVLNKERNIILKTNEFTCIKKYKGQDIIVTDGTTLLGADDKAGIAEIMEAVSFIRSHPDIKHGPIEIAFTPDEEIGRGMDKFDVKKFGAEYAFTIDGGEIGSFESENFNAATATFTITGESIHPGYAKGKMKNAIKIAVELINMLPCGEAPEYTEGREGFYHPYNISGHTDSAVVKTLIRDHSKEKFEEKKNFLVEYTEFLNKKYGEKTVQVAITDNYYNMKEIIDVYPETVKIALKAMEKAGLNPKVTPIRGGTDGARLSFMGVPTPNLFTGGHNAHSIFEYVPIQSMRKATEVILNIVKEFARFEDYEK